MPSDGPKAEKFEAEVTRGFVTHGKAKADDAEFFRPMLASHSKQKMNHVFDRIPLSASKKISSAAVPSIRSRAFAVMCFCLNF